MANPLRTTRADTVYLVLFGVGYMPLTIMASHSVLPYRTSVLFNLGGRVHDSIKWRRELIKTSSSTQSSPFSHSTRLQDLAPINSHPLSHSTRSLDLAPINSNPLSHSTRGISTLGSHQLSSALTRLSNRLRANTLLYFDRSFSRSFNRRVKTWPRNSTLGLDTYW